MMKDNSFKKSLFFLIFTSAVFENSIFLNGIHILAFLIALLVFFQSRYKICYDKTLLLSIGFVIYSFLLKDYTEGLWQSLGLPQMPVTLTICLLTYIIINNFTDSKYLMRCYIMSVICLTILIILLVRTNLLHGLHSPESDAILVNYGYNSNTIATYTCIGTVFSLLTTSKPIKKNYTFLYLAFFSLLSGSRTVILFFAVIISSSYVIHKGNVIKILIGIISFLFLTYLLLQIDFVYDIIGERFFALFHIIEDYRKSGDFASIEETRLRMIVIGWEYFKENMLFGNGINSFSLQYSIVNGRDPVFSHCNYIELLSNMGLVGFGLYYMKFVVLIKQIIKHKTNKILLPIIGLLFALLVMDISVITYYYKIYYIVLAIISVFVREKLGQENSLNNTEYAKRR